MKPACIIPRLIAMVVLSAACTNPLFTQWTHTAADSGGYAAALMSSSQYMLVGLENGGIYRSTDEGVTWHYAWAGLTGKGPGGFAFAEFGSRIFVSTGVGIALSTDQGHSWSDANNGLPMLGSVVTGFDVDQGGRLYASGSEGVYHSDDNGTTWIKSATGLTDSLMATILYTPSYVFAATYESGIFRSSDRGITWHGASNGLGSGQGLRITHLAAMSDRVIAATRGGAYYSTDNGDTWILTSGGLDSRTVSTVAAFDSVLVAGTYGFGVYRSTDKGVTWISSSTGWPSGNVRAFCMHNGILYGGNYGLQTLFRSTDNGVTWTSGGSGITGRHVYSLAANSTTVFAANSYGVEASSDDGVTWVSPPFLFGRPFYSVNAKGPVIFAGSAGVGPYLSTDYGVTWDTANGGNTGTGPRETLCMTPDSPYVYAGTYHGVFRSSDNGSSWEQMNNGLTDTSVFTLCSANGHLFAGTRVGIFASTNRGLSWVIASNGAPTYTIESIVSIDSVILAATEYASVPSTYRSTNYGLTWSPVTNGVAATNAVFQTLLVEGNNVFGGATTGGVWHSSDLGINWTDITDGLEGPAMRVTGLAVCNGNLYAATRGGIWRKPLSQAVAVGDGIGRVPAGMMLMQNYPNPFNPVTRIGYNVGVVGGQWSVAAMVRLAVYDLLGREVAVLVNDPKAPGAYEATFDGTKFSSGVYVYRLRAGEYVESQRMMLIK